jgi:hypothetical protein
MIKILLVSIPLLYSIACFSQDRVLSSKRFFLGSSENHTLQILEHNSYLFINARNAIFRFDLISQSLQEISYPFEMGKGLFRLALSKSNDALYVVNRDNEESRSAIVALDVNSLTKIREYRLPKGIKLPDLAFESPDGTKLFSTNLDHLCSWNKFTAKHLTCVKVSAEMRINNLDNQYIDEKNGIIASLYNNPRNCASSLTVWNSDPTNGKIVNTRKVSVGGSCEANYQSLLYHKSTNSFLVLSPQGSMKSNEKWGKWVTAFDTMGNEKEWPYDRIEFGEYHRWDFSSIIDPTGRFFVVTTNGSKDLQYISFKTGKFQISELMTTDNPDWTSTVLKYSSDSSKLYVGYSYGRFDVLSLDKSSAAESTK